MYTQWQLYTQRYKLQCKSDNMTATQSAACFRNVQASKYWQRCKAYSENKPASQLSTAKLGWNRKMLGVDENRWKISARDRQNCLLARTEHLTWRTTKSQHTPLSLSLYLGRSQETLEEKRKEIMKVTLSATLNLCQSNNSIILIQGSREICAQVHDIAVFSLVRSLTRGSSGSYWEDEFSL